VTNTEISLLQAFWKPGSTKPNGEYGFSSSQLGRASDDNNNQAVGRTGLNTAKLAKTMNPILLYIWWRSIALGMLDVAATSSGANKHKTGAALSNHKTPTLDKKYVE